MDCGWSYKLSRPKPIRWWRDWSAPDGHWQVTHRWHAGGARPPSAATEAATSVTAADCSPSGSQASPAPAAASPCGGQPPASTSATAQTALPGPASSTGPATAATAPGEATRAAVGEGWSPPHGNGDGHA